MRHVFFGLKATLGASGFLLVGWRAISDGSPYAVGVGIVFGVLGVLLWSFNLYWLGLGAKMEREASG